MNKKIRGIVDYYVRKYDSRDPFTLASHLNIEVQYGDMGSRSGCYMFLKNHRCIFLNENLSHAEKNLIMAHELGHAIMHRKQNCYFIRNKTLLLNSKTEREANMFAAELLIEDRFILDYQDYTAEQLARLTGYDKRLIELRLKSSLLANERTLISKQHII